ncbi:MAG TPA: twin-arginine translocase TatA/TatE family subunit [Egibacteraceae bacterium]|nr:twin-arginine translocase TatA/TatE family subunit [Egibacteraceae bacterium]
MTVGHTLAISTPGFGEIVALAVLALLIFGPERLPGMARNAGRAVSRFRQEASTTLDELKRTAELDELRGVADELRATGSELKRTAALTGSVTTTARPRKPADSTATANDPPPFDPDAT